MYTSLDTNRFGRPPNNPNLFKSFPYSTTVTQFSLGLSPGNFSISGAAATLSQGAIVNTALGNARFNRPPNNPNLFRAFPYAKSQTIQLALASGSFSVSGQAITFAQNIQYTAIDFNRFRVPPTSPNKFKVFPYSRAITNNALSLSLASGVYSVNGQAVGLLSAQVYQVSSLENKGPRTPPFNLNLFRQFPYTTDINAKSLVLNPGSFVVNGQAIGFGGQSLALAAGSFSFTGQPLSSGLTTQLLSGTYTVAGQSITLARAGVPTVNPYLQVWLPTRLFTVYWGQKVNQMQFFDKLIPGESNSLVFNFAAGLPSGYVLTGTPTVSISVYLGTDPNPSSVLVGGGTFINASTAVEVPVQPTVADTMYKIEVICATTDPGITLGLEGILPVGN